MSQQDRLVGTRLLLMGSKAFRSAELPGEVMEQIDEAIARNMTIVVGEVPGACRLYQDHLKSKGYASVTVGHAKSMRYNAGNWTTKQYGGDVHERETRMIEECDSAVIIWTDSSGVIAENLELLKRLGKPTFLYEYSTETKQGKAGWLDVERVYDDYFEWKENLRKRKRKDKRQTRDNQTKLSP